jgi:hypothetical protein
MILSQAAVRRMLSLLVHWLLPPLRARLYTEFIKEIELPPLLLFPRLFVLFLHLHEHLQAFVEAAAIRRRSPARTPLIRKLLTALRKVLVFGRADTDGITAVDFQSDAHNFYSGLLA